MDILRKELEEIYHAQGLEGEVLPKVGYESACDVARKMAEVTDGCAVITDAASDTCFVASGAFGRLMGYAKDDRSEFDVGSSDEDAVYERIHPEDLVEKRMLEYELFKLADRLPLERKCCLQ